MRNLKKILALVLALVMSLSLMATASAGSFSDVEADNQYKTAIDVLDELKVFQGYKEDNTFRPTEDLNRAQAAVLVYRIATGDAEDKQVANYTEMANSKFEDLEGYNWAKGYINYCQNAGIVIGTDATHFAPGAKVTGYQLLVMLLRTLGYGQAGEFSNGRTWELQTAKIAEREGILKNINTGDLGAPAKRQMVAEILFQGLLTETVQYSIMTPDGYTKGETLGKREFGLEEIEGVVVANEFADLYSDQVLAEGRTNLEVAEDDIRSLAISTEITDIGESRYAYITGSKVLAMGDTGNNKITEFGSACDISTNAKFNAVAEMTKASDIEFYENFERSGYWTSDYRIEYEMYRGSVTEDYRTWYKDFNGGEFAENEDGTWTYHKLIPATDEITNEDYDNIRSIFYRSNGRDWDDDKGTGYVYSGKVFVATQTTKDISDEISFNQFVDTYLKDKLYNDNWGVSFNGQWVKFVDNDGDGQAEYAFKTNSWLDEALEVYTNKDGATVTVFYDFDDDNDPRAVNGDYQVRYMNGETPAVGDKVIAAWIDNQILVEPAKDETATVSSYSWREDKITTDKGDFGQSGIGNATDMLQYIATMSDKTEYVMYLDHFGYVRAYEWPGASNYALVTEIYARNNANGNIVRDWPMTVELSIPNEDKTGVDTKEYGLNGGSGNLFVTSSHNNQQAWTLINNYSAIGNYYNWLQPATAHMGVGAKYYEPQYGVGELGTGSYRYWPNVSRQEVREIKQLTENDTFNYGDKKYTAIDGKTEIANVGTVSFTNVALADIDGENATLQGAARLKLDRDGSVMWYDVNKNGKWDAGERARYSVDYVQLSTTLPVAEDAVRYPIDSYTYDNNGKIIQDTAYIAANNNYVNAVHDTEYYIVYDGGVYYFKDFVNMPALTEKNVGEIHAAYAVAKDVSSDNADAPYWVADVIVYEVQKWNNDKAGSISLAYYTPSRTTGDVQNLSTINAKHGLTQLVPGSKSWSADRWQWGANWDGYGFYKLTNETAPEEGVMKASDITRIPSTAAGDYGANNIHAGIVTREAYIANGGWYIDVNMGWNAIYPWMGARVDMPETATSIASIEITDKIYSVTTDDDHQGYWYDYNEATLLRYKNKNDSQVKAGDLVIWVGDAKATAVSASGVLSTTNFVVDLGNEKNNADLFNRTAAFLFNKNDEFFANGEWLAIMAEQVQKAIGLSGVDADVAAAESAIANNDLKAMQAALKALTDNYPADKTNATDYKKASDEIAKLNLAIANQPIEAAIREKLAEVQDYYDAIAEEYKTNPNVNKALAKISTEMTNLRNTLNGQKLASLDGLTQDQIDVAVATGISNVKADTTLNTIKTAVNTILAAEPTPDPEPELIEEAENTPDGITVAPGVDTDDGEPTFDVTIPASFDEDITGQGFKIPLLFKAGVKGEVDPDTVPAGFKADLKQGAAPQTQSTADAYVEWTLTITRTNPAAEWAGDPVTIILTEVPTEEPEEPVEGMVSVKLYDVDGNAVPGVEVSPETTSKTAAFPTITLTVSADKTLPAVDNQALPVTMVVNGQEYTDFTYVLSENNTKATIKTTKTGTYPTGDIAIYLKQGKTVGTKTAATVTVNVTGGPTSLTTLPVSPSTTYVDDQIASVTVDMTAVPAGYTVAKAQQNAITMVSAPQGNTPGTPGDIPGADIDLTTGKVTFAAQNGPISVTGNIVINLVLTEVVNVTMENTNVTFATKTWPKGTDVTNLTLTAKPGHKITKVMVKVGEGNAVEFSLDQQSNKYVPATPQGGGQAPTVSATADITVTVTTAPAAAVAATGNMILGAEYDLYVGDEFPTSGLKIKMDPAVSAAYYIVPEKVTVTMGELTAEATLGQADRDGVYTLTFAQNVIPQNQKVTGDISIAATATKKVLTTITLAEGTQNVTLTAPQQNFAATDLYVGATLPTGYTIEAAQNFTLGTPTAMMNGASLKITVGNGGAITFGDNDVTEITGDIVITVTATADGNGG